MEIEFARIIRALRKRWWLPILIALTLGALVGGVNAALPSSYTATTRILIIPGDVSGVTIVGGDPEVIADIATSSTVLESVIADLELGITAEDLRGQLIVEQQTGTSMILISVTDSDPQLATDISNAVAEELENQVAELTSIQLQTKKSELEFQSDSMGDQLITVDARIDLLSVPSDETEESQARAELENLQEERLVLAQSKADVDGSLRGVRFQIARLHSEISIIEPAQLPGLANGASSLLLIVVGAVVGFIGGLALVLLAAFRDRTVSSGGQVAKITGVPVLRQISPDKISEDFRLVHRLVRSVQMSRHGEVTTLALAAPTRLEVVDALWAEEGNSDELVLANGIVSDEDSLSAALNASGVVIFAQLGKTIEADLQTAIESLRVANIPMLGSIVVGER